MTTAGRYDVFVSYRHVEPEQSWVRGPLVSAFKQAGLRVCVDHECFGIGKYVVDEMARAVEESRYTLAVLSPAYLESGFTEIENVMAAQLGLEARDTRLLAVMRVPCTVPLRFRSSIWLDMSSDDKVPPALVRLIAALQRPDAG